MSFRTILIAALVAAYAAQTAYPQNPPSSAATKSPADGNIRNHGAKADGANDHAAIQAAVESSSGVVYLPPGTYRISKPIVVNLSRTGFTAIKGDGVARVIMSGEGPAFKFVGTYQGSAAPSPKNDDVWKNERMPSVDGIEIVGDHPQANGIEATGVMQLTITRVLIRHCLHGIHLTGRNRNIILSDCHVYNNRGMGVFLDDTNLHQINLTGCHISYNLAGGVCCVAGEVRNLHINGCDIEQCNGKDFPHAANVLIDNTGGSVAEVAIAGCTIQHGNINIYVKGPSIPRPPTIPERRDGHITITGNVLSDVVDNIRLEHARGVVITGNTIWQAEKYNLLADHCSSIVLGPNSFDRNPRYGGEPTDDNAILFRDCSECSITGLMLRDVRRAPAGITLENCDRFHVSGITIFDCDNIGLLMESVSRSQITGCMIRDDRPDTKSLSIKATGSKEVTFSNNVLARPSELEAKQE